MFIPFGFWRAPGAAGVTLDDFSGVEQTSAADPWTGLTHALGASANYILAMVGQEAATAIAEVTAGGVAMTAGVVAGPPSGSTRLVRSFWLDNSGSFPSPGNISVVVDPDGATLSGYLGVWSLIGAASGAPNRTDTLTYSAGAGGSTSLATVPANAFAAGGSNKNLAGAATTLTGEDVEDFFADGADGGHESLFAHNLPLSESTITHTWAGGGTLAALMTEILAA